jgi:alpha-beta hydrolase superfamily lysophospholipase
MKEKDLNWISPDGIKFFAHTWQPDGKIRAAVTLVHGFGEHCLRYTPYFRYFTAKGIAVLGFDLRGHGRSTGKRGTIPSYNALMDDIDIAVKHSKELFSGVPHFIYGHIMGGNLALN